MNTRKKIKQLIVKWLPAWLLLIRKKPVDRTIYLTFDDGPTPDVTEALAKLLQEHDAKATFFVIGQKLEQHPELGKELVKQGHTIGNHSYDHRNFGRIGLKAQVRQVLGADGVIVELGQGYRGFRAPQGHWSVRLILSLFLKGYRCVHWSYDSMDYSQDSAAEIIESFRRRPVQSGDILLFHDDAQKCVQVLKELLPEWRRQGFVFRALD